MLPTIDVILIEMIHRHRIELSADSVDEESANHQNEPPVVVQNGDGTRNETSTQPENKDSAPVDNEHGHINEAEVKLSPELLDAEELNWCKMFYLAPCFGSSVGCIGTTTATLPNVIIYAFVEQ